MLPSVLTDLAVSPDTVPVSCCAITSDLIIAFCRFSALHL